MAPTPGLAVPILLAAAVVAALTGCAEAQAERATPSSVDTPPHETATADRPPSDEPGTARPEPATSSATPTAPPPPDAPLLTFEQIGGMCPTDECRTFLTVDRTGGWAVEHEDGAARDGTLGADLLTELTAMVDDADHAALTARPFTGECERHMDGSEVIVTLAPGSPAELRLSTCEHVLEDTPVVPPLERLLEAVRPGG